MNACCWIKALLISFSFFSFFMKSWLELNDCWISIDQFWLISMAFTFWWKILTFNIAWFTFWKLTHFFQKSSFFLLFFNSFKLLVDQILGHWHFHGRELRINQFYVIRVLGDALNHFVEDGRVRDEDAGGRPFHLWVIGGLRVDRHLVVQRFQPL